MNWTLIWIAAAGILAVIEVITITFFFIWIGIGAATAAIISFFHGPLYIQWIVFAIVSVALIVATRPLSKKLNKNVHLKSTKETMIGKNGVITKEVDNKKGTGEIKVDGVFWKAIALDDKSVYYQGQDVYIIKLDGLRLVVSETPPV